MQYYLKLALNKFDTRLSSLELELKIEIHGCKIILCKQPYYNLLLKQK